MNIFKAKTKNDRKLSSFSKSTDFDSIRISVASPEEILDWSHGEVLKPETINYRTQKPERDGLFCERIFGPSKDWECYCGKYKKIRYKGVVCDKCGVEVTRSNVRRERMGHIDLAAPVAHIWYLRGVPSVLGTILDLTVSDLEKVIYFASYIILDVDEKIKEQAFSELEKEYQDLKKSKDYQSNAGAIDASYKQVKQEISTLVPKRVISEARYHDLSMKYGQIIRVGIGAEAIYELLNKMDSDKLMAEIETAAEKSQGGAKRKLLRRLRLLSEMKKAKILPQWLITTKLPVIPPDLRPMVQLDGGRFAASDLNDLYRRVLNRNNRLKKLASQGAPEVICRNEKRMLQEAVDALIDNSARRGKAAATTGGQRKLRSLSDMLRGKQGRFRQNLLGKRVDYSGRSVIVVGPDLKLHQCGLPKAMALELFKPYVVSKLINDGIIHNVKNASRLIEKGDAEVWDALEQITSQSYVLLNRAPTLHRLGIQAFQPVLIEGKAIQIHPLVCLAFNADFDGDQMAVHVPLSKQACYEAKEIMRSSHNLLKPASGEPVVSPRLDMVFGCFYMTSFEDKAQGEGKVFGSKNEAIYAYQTGNVHLRAKIKIKMALKSDQEEQLVETSVGRILFNIELPKELRYRNYTMDAKSLKSLVKDCFDRFNMETTSEMVDRIKRITFEYAGLSGMTISIDDIEIPKNKAEIIDASNKLLDGIDKQYRRGLITDEERSVKTTELWMRTKDMVENEMLGQFNKNNSVYIIVTSGARGSKTQLTQMAGMKGLLVNPSGKIIEIPVKSNFKEGLSELEYFISTHGARKGKSDTALRTSDAGYLTRRLVDVSQDIVVREEDCKTDQGFNFTKVDSDELGIDFYQRITGRITTQNIFDSKTKQKIVGKNQEITLEVAEQLKSAKIEEVQVRSAINCKTKNGVCQKCYGKDLGTGKLVNLGEAVGVMAAQAIGEPGTQLTLKTFHMGGVTGEDITTGLPRVEELFEARRPRTPAVMSEIEGVVKIKTEKDKRIIDIDSDEILSETFEIADGYNLTVKNGEVIKAKQALATATDKKAIRASFGGKVKVEKNQVTVKSLDKISKQYIVSLKQTLKVKNGEKVTAGQQITEGHLDLGLALKLTGKQKVQHYIISSIQEIYNSQGQVINDKHLEIILKQMFCKVYVKDGGDSEFISGQIINATEANELNTKLKKEHKKPVISEEIIMGVTRVALKTESFLSAASFQETTSILIDAAVKGKVDNLSGLKENVIIGKLIPAGTNYHKS